MGGFLERAVTLLTEAARSTSHALGYERFLATTAEIALTPNSCLVSAGVGGRVKPDLRGAN